ncbi:citrate synthase [Aliicoccus persicus]|uniref:Citrate synthase n=1 Tax=Aliicoccus persicus TaxID=930138 RepID=A0A662Z1K2_9STAP|nr:citrate synthase [Aliicoccus persicus]SEV86903.1 citrate synthase [Aliicoccus persicus]HJE19929.1 citrate synthase [Aliicoccus persicus]
MAEKKGLEGIVAAETKISSIIGTQLTYSGYEIDDLTENAQFEEVVYLIWNQKLPNKAELADFKAKLNSYMSLEDGMKAHLKSYDLTKVHPMAALRTSISMLAHFDEDADDMSEEKNKEKAIRIQAKVASLVAGIARVRNNKDIIEPNSDLSFAANFLYMLNGELPSDVEEEAINKALILHADHELNASTFTARVCVATLSDIYSGVVAAAGALKGPLHGGANEAVMKMLGEIGSLDNVDAYIHSKLENKEKIMGMGHRVYKEGDPRAKYLKEMSKLLTEQQGEPELHEMSSRIAEIVKNEKGLLPNVDFYSATVYHSLGIDHDLFTPIFTLSRVSGWLAHILEQYADNRLIRPRAEYVGPDVRKYTSIDERN